jgi:hypothetical protein
LDTPPIRHHKIPQHHRRSFYVSVHVFKLFTVKGLTRGILAISANETEPQFAILSTSALVVLVLRVGLLLKSRINRTLTAQNIH